MNLGYKVLLSYTVLSFLLISVIESLYVKVLHVKLTMLLDFVLDTFRQLRQYFRYFVATYRLNAMFLLAFRFACMTRSIFSNSVFIFFLQKSVGSWTKIIDICLHIHTCIPKFCDALEKTRPRCYNIIK